MRISADVHGTRPDRIALASPYAAKDLIRQVPGARWSKDDSAWSVPLAWTACLALREIFGDDLELGDELTKWAWNLRRDVLAPALALRESLGEEIDGDGRLYPFQRAGVEFLSLVKRALLTDEMGVGKTVQAILALKRLREAGAFTDPILVVCPNTMKLAWERELGTWWPEAEAQVIAGDAAKRRKQIAQVRALADDGKIAIGIINWESLRTHSRLAPYGSYALRRCVECGGSGTVKQVQCEVHVREFNTMDFGAVVADEVHRAKDPSSAQTRALRAASGDAPVRFGLTGTPIANDVTELWSILHWLDEQEWPAKSVWVERLVDMTYNVWGGQEVNGIKPGHEKEFHSGVDPKMRRMTKAVVLPYLPQIVYERRDVEMHPRQAKAYEEMRDLMLARLDAGVLMAANSMTQVNRLLQLASSYGNVFIERVPVRDKETGEHKRDEVTGELLYKDQEHLRLVDPSAKLDAFMTDVKLGDFGEESVVVFAESRQLIDMLSGRMRKDGVEHGLITGMVSDADRARAIDDFQKAAFRYILCTIKAGGTGITLTRASTEAFIQRNWSPIEMSQAIARAHRIGSEIHDSITVIDYVSPSTVELAQIVSLMRKKNALEEIVRDEDMLRRLLMGDPLD